MTKIFVYGSLLRGMANHDVIKDAQYGGRARTAYEFTMVRLGYYPGVVHEGDQSIVGELYELSPVQLQRVDMLEGHPDYYKRKQIVLNTGDKAWIYLLGREYLDKYPHVPDGYWKRYYRAFGKFQKSNE
jgi:gamma-glutamylcyclotransferase (GGCT)/AIG2-like uncharacterized protein YtfP